MTRARAANRKGVRNRDPGKEERQLLEAAELKNAFPTEKNNYDNPGLVESAYWIAPTESRRAAWHLRISTG
jgi:hypothetical protein